MADFRIQSFQVTVLAGASQTDIPIPSQVDPERTRIIPGGPHNQLQALSSSGSVVYDTRDLQIGLELIDPVTVRIHSSPNKTWDGVACFVILEYVGVIGGPNEFTVERTKVLNPLGSNGFDLEAVGFSVFDPAKTTTHIVGVHLDNTVSADSAGVFHTATAFYPLMRFVTDYDTLEFQQIWVGLSDHAMWVYVEQVNWIGSNWAINFAPFGEGTVARADTITFEATPKSSTLANALDWANSWIEQHRGIDLFTDPVDEEFGSHIVGDLATDDEVIVWSPAAGNSANVVTNGAYICTISNSISSVSHQGWSYSTGDPELELTDPNGPRTLQIPIATDSAEIDVAEGGIFALLGGSPLFLSSATTAQIGHASGDELTLRRSNGFAGWKEYIQTVQLGLADGVDGTIGDSVIQKPDWLVDISHK